MTKLYFTLDQQKNLRFSIDLNYLFVLLVFLIRFSMNTISFQSRLSDWWAQVDSNHRPRAYQARALTT